MSRTVTIHVAKTTLSQLIVQVEAGEEIVIARDKTPVAKLVPILAPHPKRRFGAMRGKAEVDAAFFEPLPEDELRRWE
ncbi:MAG: type II toxin-antitoxin system Phd/YefM family antitoxin [Acidobacteriota bacterium]